MFQLKLLQQNKLTWWIFTWFLADLSGMTKLSNYYGNGWTQYKKNYYMRRLHSGLVNRCWIMTQEIAGEIFFCDGICLGVRSFYSEGSCRLMLVWTFSPLDKDGRFLSYFRHRYLGFEWRIVSISIYLWNFHLFLLVSSCTAADQGLGCSSLNHWCGRVAFWTWSVEYCAWKISTSL